MIGSRSDRAAFFQEKRRTRTYAWCRWNASQVFAEEAMPCPFERLPCNKTPEVHFVISLRTFRARDRLLKQLDIHTGSLLHDLGVQVR
jgi:hypothetical protein